MSSEVSPKQKIVICGGGNAAHVFTAIASSKPNNEVHLLSLYKSEAKDFETALNKTKDKQIKIDVVQQNKQIKGKPSNITNDPRCLSNADIVIISLPAFAHNQYLNAIKENIKPRKNNKKTLVAVFPGAGGLECDWQSIFGSKQKHFVLLSCITLPWACRILEYGQKVQILGTKNQIEVGIKSVDDNDDEDDIKGEEDSTKKDINKVYIKQISDIIGIPPMIKDNGHILNMSLSAIKAIVHPSIMYSKWKDYDGKPMDSEPLFYQGIDRNGSDMMSKLSGEVIEIIKCIEKETGLKLLTQHIYDWYISCYGKECSDTSCLYKIIITNPAYNGLKHPMIKNDDDKYIPNWKYRYLSEDIPFGLVVIRGLSLILNDRYKCNVPLMDKIIIWAQKVLNKEYLKYLDDGTIVAGKDINESRAPQRYNINSIKQLI